MLFFCSERKERKGSGEHQRVRELVSQPYLIVRAGVAVEILNTQIHVELVTEKGYSLLETGMVPGSPMTPEAQGAVLFRSQVLPGK